MITKIQSFTDVITNSSSTVFVMHKDDANHYYNLENTEGCIRIEPITMEWLHNNVYEFQMVCDFLNIDPSEVTTRFDHKWCRGWNIPSQEDWKTFLELHKDKIEESLIGLYWVDIEDHFENAWEVTENASDDAVWADWRH